MNCPDIADTEKLRCSSGNAAGAAFFGRWDSLHAPTPVRAPTTAMPMPMGSALVTDRRRTPDGAGSAPGWSGWWSASAGGWSASAGGWSGCWSASADDCGLPGASPGRADCWETAPGSSEGPVSSAWSSASASAWTRGYEVVVALCVAIQLVSAQKQRGCSRMAGCRSGRRVAIRASSPAGVSGLRSASASRSGCD